MGNFIDRSRRLLGGGGGSDGGSIEDQIGAGPPPAGGTDEPEPIGVPKDYEAAVQNQYRPGYYPHGFNYTTRSYGQGGSPSDPGAIIGPRYHTGDEWKPAQLSPAAVSQLQRAMATAGLLTDFRYGIWDEQSAKAYAKVLGYANASGLTDQMALSQMVNRPQLSTGGSGSGGGGSRVVGFDENGNPIYAGPDPLQVQLTNRDDLRRVIRGVVIDRLGQGWSQAQIDELADAYNWQELKVQKDAYDQQQAASMGMGGGAVMTPSMPSPETFAETELQRRDPVGYQAGGVIQDSLPMFLNALKGWSA